MAELTRQLGIDWRLLTAQAVNFLILFFIFKKFALRPLMDMLSTRRREIAKGLAYTQQAEERLASAKQERDGIIKEARTGALAIVSEAEKIAKTKKGQMIAETRKKAEEIEAETKRRFQEERAKHEEEVMRNAETLVRLGIERVLGRMVPEERDSVLIREALQELSRIKDYK